MTQDEVLLTTLLQCRRVDLYAWPVVMTGEQRQRYEQMRERVAEGEPLQYVTGECEFCGLPLCVDSRVLIPRPETELLVEYALVACARLRPHIPTGEKLRVLDLGTGSGNIAIALAAARDDVVVTAVDISADALAVAEINAVRHGVIQRITFVRADMRRFVSEAPHASYDLIISNPPYIPSGKLATLPTDVKREPVAALDGGVDGLDFYRCIVSSAAGILSARGCLLFEIGDGQRDAIHGLCEKISAYRQVHVQADYVGTERIMCISKTLVTTLNYAVGSLVCEFSTGE